MKKMFLSGKRAGLAVLCGLLCTITLSMARFDASCEELRNGVLRLHIIANSDCAQDQEVKLAVRDRILAETAPLFSEKMELADAEETITEQLFRIEKTANEVLKESGKSYTAKVTVEDSFFETREYETFTLPAGTYRSVMVRLGKAEGKNWWCVVFPAVCIPAAAPEARLSDAVTDQAASVAEHPRQYEMRFKTVELYEDLKKILRQQ